MSDAMSPGEPIPDIAETRYDPCIEVSPAAFVVLGLAVRAFRP
jgi:hypothetical protein